MNLIKYIPLLQSIDLFKTFEQDDFLRYFSTENYIISKYGKKSFIYLQHEVCTTYDVILSGSVQIQTIDENGNILTITSFGTGSSLGGNLILSDNNTYPMGIIAKDTTILLKLNKELIVTLCQQDKNFLLEFIRDISNRSVFLGTKLRTMTMKSIREHIIDFLKYQYFIQDSMKIELNMSKREWSERLGVQRPSLSRELSRMKDEGLIDYDKHFIIIKDISLIN